VFPIDLTWHDNRAIGGHTVSVPTVSDVDTIGAIGDPVIRNLRITQCYHELARAVAERVAPGANWCTFATWASRQAGQTIRGEDFARAAEGILGSHEVAQVITDIVRLSSRTARALTHDTVLDALRRAVDPEAALRRAADAVAIGNRKVFVEIGRECARGRGSAAAAGAPDTAATAAFADGLRAGEPPDGQRLLREAFAAYGNASATPNDSERAALLLLGNLLIGLHEQTRLQPEIQASLDAAVDADAVRAALYPLVMPGAWLRLRARIARLTGRPMPADVAVDALVAAVRRRLRLVITDLLMTLRLPGVVLHLGRDLSGEFPPEFRTIDYAPLRTLLASIDPTPNATAGSGAADWANLRERMHYIADLFRCWHARPELFTAPFTGAQVAALRDGRRPDGSL
jgi:hypothetical protein